MSNCIFCDIIAEKSSAAFVHQDDLCVAFMDIRPINPGHVLVVPRVHTVLLTELDPQTAGHLMQVAQKVDQAIRMSAIQCQGVNLFLADGRAAGQDVMHVHLHVFPRFEGDGHHLRFSPAYFMHTPRSELEKMAELIRQQIPH